MPKSREKITRDAYEIVGATNNERLLLLASIKSFNHEVEKIRKRFGIDYEQYQDPLIFAADQWYEANQHQKFNPAMQLPGSTDFKKAVAKLCKSFNVPEHFYNVYLQGVPLYIVSGVISAPTENWQYSYSDKSTGSVGFKFFSPLTNDELFEFNRVLVIHFDPKQNGMQTGSKVLRSRRQFMRDWEMAIPLVNRAGQPKRIKQYEPGSYLAVIAKDRSISKKKFAQLEKLHADSVVVVYDQPTASSQAKGKRVSIATVRQAKRRLNVLAKQLYGRTLEE